MRSGSFWLIVLTVAGFAAGASLSVLGVQAATKDSKVLVGKNPGEVKGRWLEVRDPAKLKEYGKVSIGEVTSDIERPEGKDSPIDEEILIGKIREHLVKNLNESNLFEDVSSSAPGEGEEGVVRLDCELIVDPGSRAARYFVGLGAGKSQSFLDILLIDHATGEELGRYHGYGAGSGMGFKVGGGGARKMTQDDIQENAKKFVELLKQVL